MTSTDPLRDQLARFQSWHDAHADFDAVVSDFPSDLRGIVPPGLPYSAWQVLEHVRRAQEDILEFCRNPHYKEREWPADYWPSSPEPPNAKAWEPRRVRPGCAPARRVPQVPILKPGHSGTLSGAEFCHQLHS